MKLPRQEVVERQLEIVQETFEAIDDAALEQLRGGQIVAKYGVPPRRNPCDIIRKKPAGQLSRNEMALGQAQCGLPRPTKKEVDAYKDLLF
jgi:hypothetical protein